LCSTNASITGKAWTHKMLLEIVNHLKLNVNRYREIEEFYTNYIDTEEGDDLCV